MYLPCSVQAFRKIIQAFAAWAGAVFFLFIHAGLNAQSNVSFEAAISVKEVIVGVPFELNFTLKNAEGSRFNPPALQGFKNGGTSEMRGMSIVNGRSSSSQTWTLELTPTRPGVFNIGPATVQSGGRTLSTKSLTVNVLNAAASSKGNVNVPPGSDGKVFVAADLDRDEVYLGQQVSWRIRLYTQLSVEGYDIISLPNFERFFSREMVRYDKRVEYLTLRGKKYAVRTLHELALFPQETGDITVGAARVSVGIEQPGTQGFLFGPKPVSLQTEPLTLKVKALPQPAPTAFTGGVGSYEWEVKADTSLLSTDDALTLTVELKGNGDTRRFAPPKITVPPTCEIFEPRILEEEEYEGEAEILHRKKFEYVVLPKDTGNYEINPVLAYFNPDSNRFCQLHTAPIKIRVTAGKNYQSPNVPPESTAQEPVILQEPGLGEQLLGWLSSPFLWGIVVLPFLVLGLFFLIKRKRPVPATVETFPASTKMWQQNEPKTTSVPQPDIRQTPEPSYAKPAQTSFEQRFASAGRLVKGDDPQRFYQELFRAIQGWLAAKFGIQTAQMNDAEVSTVLLRRGASPIRTQALLAVWHTCEQAIYGGQAQADQMESTWQMARQVVEGVEAEVRV